MTINLTRCNCKGKDGKLKKLYPNYTLAAKNAYYAKETRRIHLNIYECPQHLGYHLTSNQHQY